MKARGVQRRPARKPPAHVRGDAFASLDRDACYWIGLLFADGWLDGNRVALALHYRDGAHMEAFARFLGLARSPRRYRDQVRVSVRSPELASRLRELGLNAQRCPAPELCAEAPFWRGMVDGDGSVLRYGTQYLLRLNGNEIIVNCFLAFARASGCITRAVTRTHASIYRAQLSGAAAKHLLAVLYGDAEIALPRKAKVAMEALK